MRLAVIPVLILVLITSCISLVEPTQSDETPFEVVLGTVNYPNNLYFPSRIRLEISLIDSDDDILLVNQSIRNPQKFPVNFTLRYDKSEIKRNHSYYIYIELFNENENEPTLTTERVALSDQHLIFNLK
ncbi:MAG: YbaY family lipoprotein [Sphaerochaetaceae bacterium]|jgi:uncharacterized lipoprotein YbaY